MRPAVLLLCAAFAWTPASARAATAQTPVGLWRAYSDRTGRETATIRIEQQGGVLIGRVVGIANPANAHQSCHDCSGSRKGQPLLGLTIITNMRQDGARWDGGQILNPRDGSIYRCIIRLKDGGNRLLVRGFIGLALFGRSQTWVRVP